MAGERIAAALLLLSTLIGAYAKGAWAGEASHSPYHGVPVEVYRVQKGDWLWDIARRKGLLERYNRHDLLELLRRLNPGKPDLTVLRPGEKLRLPAPSAPASAQAFQEYRVKAGDTLFSILTRHFAIPTTHTYQACLDRVKALNPEMTDPGRLKAGQVLRLPVEFVIKQVEKTAGQGFAQHVTPARLTASCKRIVRALGGDWMDEGVYQVPLASGQSMRLSAADYPLARLPGGAFLILDQASRLPPSTARMIRDEAKAYRLLSMPDKLPLKSAVERFLRKLVPDRLLETDKALQLEGAVHYTLWGDWVLRPDGTGQSKNFVVINLWQSRPEDEGVYALIKSDLSRRGVRFVDIPRLVMASPPQPEIPRLAGKDARAWVRTILTLCGRRFSEKVPIAVYRSGAHRRKMMLKADFFLRSGERDVIIDLGALNPGERVLLEEHRFLVVPQDRMAKPLALLAQVLDALPVGAEKGPHSLRIAYGGQMRAAIIQAPGLAFDLPEGKRALLFPPAVSPQLAAIFKARGRRVYRLP